MAPPDVTPVSASDNLSDEVSRIANFARIASFETTHLSEEQLAEVKASARPGCDVYVAAIPSRPLAEQIQTTKDLHRFGFNPVPHLAARNFESLATFETQLRAMADEAGVKTALAIAGDRNDAAGPFSDALSLIKSGMLQRCGITEIGISSYAEGHPRITDDVLARALKDKLAAANDAGLKVRIVSQFTMSTPPIVDMVKRLRDQGIENAVGIGLAGPASMTTLLRFARICGVKTAVSGAVRNAGLLKNLVGAATADPIVRALTHMRRELGDIHPHFFSFGGLPATTRWVGAAAAGRIRLNKDGFDILSK